jgi:hypothetical protein
LTARNIQLNTTRSALVFSAMAAACFQAAAIDIQLGEGV